MGCNRMAGIRQARDFLRKLGVGGRLAQTLVERYGVHTEARMRQDPYAALFSVPSVSFRWGLADDPSGMASPC
jgi:hypothetical protein